MMDPIEEPRAGVSRKALPIWAMGLANAPTGFVYGFISTAFGILLTARGVPVGTVAGISATAFSPTWWGWLLCPVLDVRFTKRAYAWVFAALAAVWLGGAVLSLNNLTLFTPALTISCLCAVFYTAALNGSVPDIVGDAEYDRMSGWLNVANLGAAGVFSWIAVEAVHHLPRSTAALLLGLMVFLPALLLLGFPSPRRPEGTLRATFAAMARDLRRILQQGRVWIGLALFLSPASCFALTNLFSSLGADFHASERTTLWLNSSGVAVVCSLGSLLAIPLARACSRRAIYLGSGFVAAVCALLAAWLPHTVVVFAVVVLLYNMAQGFNYTSYSALQYEIVGPRNALAASTIAMLTAAVNFPITMMTKVEGSVYEHHGLRSMLLTDSFSSIGSAALLVLLALPLLDRLVRRAGGDAAAAAAAS